MTTDDRPGRIGVHGMDAGSGRGRFDPLPPSAGPWRLFVSQSGKVALEFSQATSYTSNEMIEQRETYGLPLDRAFATREEAVALWEDGFKRFYRLSYGHLFGILIYLPDAEQLAESGEQGTAEWLT